MSNIENLLRDENDSLQSDNIALRIENDALIARIKELEEQLVQTTTERDDALGSLKTEEENNKLLEEELEETREKLKETSEEASEVEEELEEARERVERLIENLKRALGGEPSSSSTEDSSTERYIYDMRTKTLSVRKKT